MQSHKIHRLFSASPDDPRGDVFEWKISDGHQITLYRRRAGEYFANHAHTGRDPSKNPERFLLISGKVKATFITRDGREDSAVIEAVSSVEIYPDVFHEMEALEDCVFIEYRVTHFDRKDPDALSREVFFTK